MARTKPTVYGYTDVTVVEAVDGDTVKVVIPSRCDHDFGFGIIGVTIPIKQTIRLYGVNCPETKGLTKAAGLAAKQFTIDNLVGQTVSLRSHKGGHEKYDRYLAEIFLADGRSFSDVLLAAGHAVPYMVDRA